MATFPKSTTGVNELAMSVLNGLDQHAELFPSITQEIQSVLDQRINSFTAAVYEQDGAKAAAKVATIAKDSAQDALEEQLHKILKLAENDCTANPENLDYIGWGPRKTPSPLAPPGQPNELEAIKEGPGVLTLTWMKTRYGGTPFSYKIERSDQPQGGGIPGPWALIATSYDISITLQNQPRGIEMQYRVSASNPAGDSMPSSIVTAIL
jgi:hypothetical protein